MPRLKDLKYTYRLSLVEQAWVLDEAQVAAQAANQPEVTKALSDALAKVYASREVEAAYLEERGRQPDAKDAITADRSVMQLVSIVNRTLQARAGLGRDTRWGRASSDLLKVAFPKALYDHAHAPFPMRSVLTDALVATLRRPENLATVKHLGLTELVDDLGRANKVFRATIAPEMGVTKEMLADARDSAEDAFLRAIYTTAGFFDPSDAASSHVRDTILFPLVAMNRKLAARYRIGTRSDDEQTAVDPADQLTPTAAEATPGAPEDVSTTDTLHVPTGGPSSQPDDGNMPRDLTDASLHHDDNVAAK